MWCIFCWIVLYANLQEKQNHLDLGSMVFSTWKELLKVKCVSNKTLGLIQTVSSAENDLLFPVLLHIKFCSSLPTMTKGVFSCRFSCLWHRGYIPAQEWVSGCRAFLWGPCVSTSHGANSSLVSLSTLLGQMEAAWISSQREGKLRHFCQHGW